MTLLPNSLPFFFPLLTSRTCKRFRAGLQWRLGCFLPSILSFLEFFHNSCIGALTIRELSEPGTLAFRRNRRREGGGGLTGRAGGTETR